MTDLLLNCPHKHTSSCSPNGVYLYVRCKDCGELLSISEEGRKQLLACPRHNPPRTGWSGSCQTCGFEYWDHEWAKGQKP